mmetsp:Transcript_8840/g.24500  ORF Transcript_8840/g.24500 Transcript_8840/m.24500 type:complete len:248 (+) Transcript_8840:386-1129(+)
MRPPAIDMATVHTKIRAAVRTVPSMPSTFLSSAILTSGSMSPGGGGLRPAAMARSRSNTAFTSACSSCDRSDSSKATRWMPTYVRTMCQKTWSVWKGLSSASVERPPNARRRPPRTSSLRQQVGQSSYMGHLRSTSAWCRMATRRETALCARHSQRVKSRKSLIWQRPYSQLSKSLRKFSLHFLHVRKFSTNSRTKFTASGMVTSAPSGGKLLSPRSIWPLMPRAATAVSVTWSRVHITQGLPSHVR